MQIRYFGGEPLLNWHVVLDSMDYAAELASQHNMTLRFYLNTNATLLNQFITHRLSVHRNSLYIIVSLDGSAAVHNAARKFLNGRGSFDLVCRGLDLIQQENIPVTTSATLGTHNREHLRGLIDLLLARNIYSLSISPICVVPENSHPQTLADALIDAIEYARPYKLQIIGFWRDIFQRLEHGTTSYTFCGGSGSELSIQPNGDVYPCHLQPFRLGTLDDIGTRALFATETYHQVAMRTVGNLPECEGCEIEGLCAGGCAADACAYEHNLHGRTRHCDFFRTMVRHHLIYLGWLAQQDIIHT
jgi:uncharacterized protein